MITIRFIEKNILETKGDCMLLVYPHYHSDFGQYPLIKKLKHLYPKCVSNLIYSSKYGYPQSTSYTPKNQTNFDQIFRLEISSEEELFSEYAKSAIDWIISRKKPVVTLIPYRLGYLPYDVWEEFYEQLCNICEKSSNEGLILIIKDEEVTN